MVIRNYPYQAACAVTVGVGTAPADGVGLGASEHPVRSMARRIAPAHSNPRTMDFDIITLLGAGLSATVASTVAFRMTRRKVCLYLLRGVHLYLSASPLPTRAATSRSSRLPRVAIPRHRGCWPPHPANWRSSRWTGNPSQDASRACRRTDGLEPTAQHSRRKGSSSPGLPRLTGYLQATCCWSA